MRNSAYPPRQYAEASGKANLTLGKIRRTTVTRDKDTKVSCTNEQITSFTITGIQHPGMKSITKTGHEKTGESAKQCKNNYLGLQEFEL